MRLFRFFRDVGSSRQPKTLLLSMETGNQGFHVIDIAMALRGLGKLHPDRIVIDGILAREEESLPLLSGVLLQLEEKKIEVIQPQIPSGQALFNPVPLCRYDPQTLFGIENRWDLLAGSISNRGEGCFLPAKKAGTQQPVLPFFAETRYGEVVGSLWWRALTGSQKPLLPGKLWLLGGRVLLLPNSAPLVLGVNGSIEYRGATDCKIIPFDDFLLQIEQKERGMLSPDFDTEWNHATVLIGTPDDLPPVSVLSLVRERISWKHPSLAIQAGMTALWIILLSLLDGTPRKIRLAAALLLLLGTPVGTAMALHHGMLIPFLPPFFTGFLLLLPGGKRS